VAAPEVPAVAEHFGGAPFDIEGVFWSSWGALHLRHDDRRARTGDRTSAAARCDRSRGRHGPSRTSR
jgi:hypothetical protein